MFYFQVEDLLKEKCQASAGAIPAMQISLSMQYDVTVLLCIYSCSMLNIFGKYTFLDTVDTHHVWPCLLPLNCSISY